MHFAPGSRKRTYELCSAVGRSRPTPVLHNWFIVKVAMRIRGGQLMSIEYLRIYSDQDGCSHFEKKRITLSSTDYAPPAPVLNTSTKEPAGRCVFLELPVGWYGNWHPTLVRQWLVLMSGECEFEVGERRLWIRSKGQHCPTDRPHRLRLKNQSIQLRDIVAFAVALTIWSRITESPNL